jgi:hypothetical protein
MNDEPENFTLALLRKIDAKVDTLRDDVSAMSEVMVTKDELRSELSSVRSEMTLLRADVASDMLTLEKRLSHQIVGLRRSVMEYHSSASATACC